MQFEQWLELFIAELLASDDDFTEEAARLEGTTINDYGAAVAVAAQHVAWMLIRRMRDRFKTTAKGDALTRLIVSELGIPRQGATAASLPLLFARSGGAPELTIPQDAVVLFAGQSFKLAQPIYWAAGNTTQKVGTGIAIELGPNGNVQSIGQGSIETPLADTTVTVANTAKGAGGNEEETDEQYLGRTRDVFARYVRATVEAIRLGALEVPGVRTAAVYESLDGQGHPSGGVVVTVADALGNANPAMAAAVLLNLNEWRGAGVYARVDAGVVVEVTCSYSAEWASGAATQENDLALRQAIVARVNKLIPRAAPSTGAVDIRCKLRPEAMFNEARQTVPGCLGVTPTLPVGTMVPDPGQVFRTRLALVSGS